MPGLASRRAAFMRQVESDFMASVRDAERDAVRRAPTETGRLERSSRIQRLGRFSARIIFDTAYATAQEKGAFIQPRAPRKTLRFKVGGRWVSARAVRLRAQPYLRPAGLAWPGMFLRRLRASSSAFTGGSRR